MAVDDRRVDTFGKAFGCARRLQLAGLLANDLVIDRGTGHCLRARRGQLRHGRRTAGLGLRHVGAGAFADLEARARCPHLLLQEFEVAGAQHRDLAIANDIHESAGCIEQDVLLGVTQALGGGSHARLGGAHVVRGLKAVEQHLLDLHAKRTGG